MSPIAGFRLASSITSEADFNTWMQYFSLPANGWAGVLPPVPSMGLACDDTSIPVVEGILTELDMPLLACRATGQQAADLVDSLWGVSSIVEEDPQIVVATLQELLDALPIADLFVRKALFPTTDQDVGSGLQWLPISNANAAAPVLAAGISRVAIRVSIWGGRAAGVYVVGRAIRSEVKQQLNNFLRGYNSRIHPLVLMGATSYLESRFDNGNNANCGGDTPCEIIRNPSIIKGISDTKTKWERRLLLNYIRDEINSKGEIQCAIDLDAFGAAFELWVAAEFHMRHEQLGENYYKLVGMQTRYDASLRSFNLDSAYDASINRFDLSASEANEENKYARFADIVIKGDDILPILVGLKSYNIPVKEQKKLALGKKFTVIKDAFIGRTPPFDPTRARNQDDKRKKTSMHCQILMDMFLTRPQPGEVKGGDNIQSGEDFRWYFQDWKPTYDKKSKDLNNTVGVSMTDVSLNRNGTDYPGVEMVAAQLSTLGAKKPGRKMLGYNLGLSESAVNERVRDFPGPLLNDIGTVTGNLGLKVRVKNFERFGGIDQQQRIKLVKGVFGVEEDSALGQLILDEKSDLLQTVEEHLDAVDELIDSGRDAVLDLVVDTDTRELVETQIEDLEELLVTTKEQIIEVGIGVLPDGSGGGNSCL